MVRLLGRGREGLFEEVSRGVLRLEGHAEDLLRSLGGGQADATLA